ncbi:MAG: hypothetical protein GC155_00610 [Alphaproteobacteria bacterium]|nr:hypothetical protein [Alphaproteobacteria bacterium]
MRLPKFTRAAACGLSAIVLAAVAASSAAAQSAGQPVIPRSADGHPDLQGIWSSQWLTPVERPASVKALVLDEAQARKLTSEILTRADEGNPLDPELSNPDAKSLAIVRGQYRSSQIIDPPDGKLPLNDAGRAAMRGYIGGLDGPEQRMTTERCIGGVGWAPLQIRSANMLHRIVQTPNYVVLHTEAYDDLRIIPVGVPHMPRAVSPPGGDSTARWDGDVLEVETRNFAPDLSTHGIVTVLSPKAVIVERFELVSPDELIYRYTVNDPEYYSSPWTAEYSLARTRDQMYEYACHEGNYSLRGMLWGARRQQREAGGGK